MSVLTGCPSCLPRRQRGREGSSFFIPPTSREAIRRVEFSENVRAFFPQGQLKETPGNNEVSVRY